MAGTAESVARRAGALTAIYRRHSQGYRHDYAARPQLLDVDLTGLPCGPKAALATKGYFAKQRNRRGGQLGRVLAPPHGGGGGGGRAAGRGRGEISVGSGSFKKKKYKQTEWPHPTLASEALK